MKLMIYEKPEPLGTMLLGIVEDVPRHNFDAVYDVLKGQGIELQRIVETEGELPRFELDGAVVLEGLYPTAQQISALLGIDASIFKDIKKEGALTIAAQDGRISACCGVGTDVYLDPYEDEE